MQGSSLNGAPLETMEEKLTRVRQAYMHALNDITDRMLEEFMLKADGDACCNDVAQFTVFLMSVKMASFGLPEGTVPTRVQVMQAFRHITRDIEKEVPEQLLAWARDVATDPTLARGE